jgi:NCS1 family nucleobase:cation symporter-1
VGFAGAVGRTVPIGATYIYRLNYFCGFIVSSVVYVLLCRFWPAKAVPAKWTEDGDQDVLEGRTTHSPNSEEDSGHLKLDEEADYDGHAFGHASGPSSF